MTSLRNNLARIALAGEEAAAFFAEVAEELARARAKFPGDNVTTLAMVEEVGELAKASFSEPRANVRLEATQTAVMCARIVLDGDQTLDEWRAKQGLDPLTDGSTRKGSGTVPGVDEGAPSGDRMGEGTAEPFRLSPGLSRTPPYLTLKDCDGELLFSGQLSLLELSHDPGGDPIVQAASYATMEEAWRKLTELRAQDAEEQLLEGYIATQDFILDNEDAGLAGAVGALLDPEADTPLMRAVRAKKESPL